MIVYSTKEIYYRRFKAIQDEIIIIRIPIAKQLEIKKKKKKENTEELTTYFNGHKYLFFKIPSMCCLLHVRRNQVILLYDLNTSTHINQPLDHVNK